MKSNISLEQLIPHPQSLRLLILHTPFPLALDPLLRCTNLIKLDVSNNAIQKVPYLGALVNLRFLFLHNNKIDHQSLKAIFQTRSQKLATTVTTIHNSNLNQNSNSNNLRSPLALNIVWLTYWGNRNQFYARHYLVNNTNVVAVDKNIVVDQQRNSNLLGNGMQPFSQKTLIDFPLIKLEHNNNGFTEEQYISYFYQQLSLLRKIQIKNSPILMIQKMWRGYIIRRNIKKKVKYEYQKRQKILRIANHWRQYTRKRIKLKQILKKRGKQYLLYDIKNYKRILIYKKLLQLAHKAKQRVKQMNRRLKNERLVYRIIRRNYCAFKQLYSYMQFEKYNCLYFGSQSLQILQKVIIPFVYRFNPNMQTSIKIQKQNALKLIRSGTASNSKIPFVHILSFSIKSQMLYTNQTSNNKLQKHGGLLFSQIPIKNRYFKVHMNNQQLKKLKDADIKLMRMMLAQKEQLLMIQNQPRVLMDLSRAVYHYNRGKIGINNQQKMIITIIPKSVAVMVHSALKIQKIWKGYKVRKTSKIKLEIQKCRAAKKIQRWFRKLPSIHKKNFIFMMRYRLNTFDDKKFLLEMSDYLNLNKYSNQKKYTFLQQHILLLFQRTSRSITFTWNPKNSKLYQDILTINSNFQKSVLSKSCQLSLQIEIPNLINTEMGDIYHAVNYQTTTKIVYAGENKYALIQCDSIQETKIRVLALMLITYRFSYKNRIKILNTRDLQEKNQRKSNNKLTTFPKQIVDNNLCSFIFTQSHVQYFKKYLDKTSYPYFKDQMIIYLKQTRNSFPFKVSQIMFYTTSSGIYFKSDAKKPLQDIKRDGNTPKQQNQILQFKKQNLTLPKNQAIISLKKNHQIDQQINNINKQIKSLQKIKKQIQPMRSNSRSGITRNKNTKAVSITYTKQKTQQSLRQLIPSNKKKNRQKRFLTEVSLQQQQIMISNCQPNNIINQNKTSNIYQISKNNKNYNYSYNKMHSHHHNICNYQNMKLKTEQDHKFTNNFVNLSNFLSKQYQKSHIRKANRALATQLNDTVIQLRQQQKRSTQKINRNKYLKEKLIRQNYKQYNQQINNQLTQNKNKDQVLMVESGKDSIAKRKSKIHIVFPQQCYPLFPLI